MVSNSGKAGLHRRQLLPVLRLVEADHLDPGVALQPRHQGLQVAAAVAKVGLEVVLGDDDVGDLTLEGRLCLALGARPPRRRSPGADRGPSGWGSRPARRWRAGAAAPLVGLAIAMSGEDHPGGGDVLDPGLEPGGAVLVGPEGREQDQLAALRGARSPPDRGTGSRRPGPGTSLRYHRATNWRWLNSWLPPSMCQW